MYLKTVFYSAGLTRTVTANDFAQPSLPVFTSALVRAVLPRNMLVGPGAFCPLRKITANLLSKKSL